MKKPTNPLEKENKLQQQMMSALNESYQSGRQPKDKRK